MLQFLPVRNFRWTHKDENKNKSLKDLTESKRDECIRIKDNYEKKIKLMKENKGTLQPHTLHNNYPLCSKQMVAP